MSTPAWNKRFLESLDMLADEAKTRYVEKWVNAYLDRGYKPTFDTLYEQSKELQGDALIENRAEVDRLRDQKDMLKNAFTSALEEAVYGIGGRKKADLKAYGAKTSWQEQLLMGPIGLEKRIQVAREALAEKLQPQCGAHTQDLLQVYDYIAADVKKAVEAELAKAAQR
jgi:hypothetical protein